MNDEAKEGFVVSAISNKVIQRDGKYTVYCTHCHSEIEIAECEVHECYRWRKIKSG